MTQKLIEGYLYDNRLAPTRPGGTYTEILPNVAIGQIKLTRTDWKRALEVVCQHSGRVRRESGETFAHDVSGRIVFEIYALVHVAGGEA